MQPHAAAIQGRLDRCVERRVAASSRVASEARGVRKELLIRSNLHNVAEGVRTKRNQSALGRRLAAGLRPPRLSLDLLIAAVAVHHTAKLVSFDAIFEAIASVSDLRLNRLNRLSRPG